MRAGRPSRTAEQNAAFRAAESARPPGVRLLNDPYAARLLPPGLRILAWISSVPMVGGGLNWFVDTRWPGARSSIIARTRLIDEWLCAAMRVGLEQVVLLGAGFDSRAWRLPAVAHARVFEVDHPSTSAEKRRRLANLGTDRAHVRFVPVDFDRQMPADGLAQAGFDSSQRAIVIWDGVTNYLQPEAVDAITSRVGGLAEGGQFIFTYIHSGVLDGSMSFEGAAAVLKAVRRAGEPWVQLLKVDRLCSVVDGAAAVDPMYSAAERCKRLSSICRLCGHASMYPASDRSALCSGPPWISARTRSH